MKGYKGFSPGMVCRGKQYQENTEFTEPASQQENHKVIVSYEDLLKEIPGGADILWEERSVVSRTFECSGEAMHEEWRDDEKPVDALFRLYKRVRMEAILDEDD